MKKEVLRGSKADIIKLVNTHQMAQMLKKQVQGAITQLFSLQTEPKKKLEQQIVPQTNLPNVGDEGQILVELVAILDRRMINKHHCAVTQVLVH